MHDAHLDAHSCLQSAISRGFRNQKLRSPVRLYMEHGFLSDNEADAVSVLSNLYLFAPTSVTVNLDSLLQTFTESQISAYRWVENSWTRK